MPDMLVGEASCDASICDAERDHRAKKICMHDDANVMDLPSFLDFDNVCLDSTFPRADGG
jgi:hypothetical protein